MAGSSELANTADTEAVQLQHTNSTDMQEPAAATARKRALSDPQTADPRPPKMPTIYEEQESQEARPAAANDDAHDSHPSMKLEAPNSQKSPTTDAPAVTRAEKQHDDANPSVRTEHVLDVPHPPRSVSVVSPSVQDPAQSRASGTVSPVEVFGYAPSREQSREESNISHHPYYSPINTHNAGLGISGVPNLPGIGTSSTSSSNHNYHARSRSYAGFYDGFTLPATTTSPAATPPYSLYTSYGVQQPAYARLPPPPTPETNNNLTELPASQGRFPFPPNSHMEHRQNASANQIFTPQNWLPHPGSSSSAAPTGFSYLYGQNRQVQNVSPERSYRNTPLPSPVNTNNNHARRNSVIHMQQQQQMGSPSSISSPSSTRQVTEQDALMLSRINALYEQYQKYGQGAEQRNLEDHERNFYRSVANRSLQEANALSASLTSLSRSVFGDSHEGILTSPTKQQQHQPPTNELVSPDRNRASSSSASSYLRGTPVSQYHSPQLAQQQEQYTPSQIRSIQQQQTQKFAEFYAKFSPDQREKYHTCSEAVKEEIRSRLFQHIAPLDDHPDSSADNSNPASPALLSNTAGQSSSSQGRPPLLPLHVQAGLRGSTNNLTDTESPSSSALQTTTQHNLEVQAKHERAQSHTTEELTTEKEGDRKPQAKTFTGRSISIRLGGVSTSSTPKVKPEPSDSPVITDNEEKGAVIEGNSTLQDGSAVLHEHDDSGIALGESPAKVETSTPGTRRSTRDKTKTFEGLAAIADRFMNESPVKSGDVNTSNEDEDSQAEPENEMHPSTSAPPPFVFRGQRSKAFKKTITSDFQGPKINQGDIVVDLDWDRDDTVFQPLSIRFDDATNPFQLSYNWSPNECTANRRLVQYSCTYNADARELLLTGQVVQPEAYNHLNERYGAVISCIFRNGVEPIPNQGWTEDNPEVIYWVTQPDILKLADAILSTTTCHSTDLRGRIRSKVGTNTKSYQVSKSSGSPYERDFAKQIMEYDNPKPRVQDRALRVMPWLELPQLLMKIAERFWVVA